MKFFYRCLILLAVWILLEILRHTAGMSDSSVNFAAGYAAAAILLK